MTTKTHTATKTFIASAVLLTAVTAFTASASAHSTRRIDRTLDHQAMSIERGRQTGQITWLEGKKLRAEQRDIEGLRAAYLADGKLTAREYRDLRDRQETAAWNILNEKHDSRRRWRFLPRVGR